VFETTTDHGRLADFGWRSSDQRGAAIARADHCNTGPLACGQYGTALGIIQAAHHSGREIHVWVDETRPYLQGARLTTWELAQAGVPHALIPDVAAGHFIARGEVDAILVGPTGSRPTATRQRGGDPDARRARGALRHPVPGLPPRSARWTWTRRTGAGSRSRSVLAGGHGAARPPDRAGWNHRAHPAFDVTPAELISGIVTEEGVLTAPFERGPPRRVRPAGRPLGGDARFEATPAPAGDPDPAASGTQWIRPRPGTRDGQPGSHPADRRLGDPGDRRPAAPARVPGAGPPVRGVRHLRPGRARVRQDPVGRGPVRGRAGGGGAGVHRPTPQPLFVLGRADGSPASCAR